MILIKLIEIAQKLGEWEIKKTEKEDLTLSHKFIEGAKIHLYQSLARQSIYCEIDYIYKNQNLIDFMSPSERQEWSRKQAIADLDGPSERIAKQFETNLITPYLKNLKRWAKQVDLAREKEKVLSSRR